MFDRTSKTVLLNLRPLLLALLVLTPAWGWRARVLNEYQNVPVIETVEAETLEGAKAVVEEDPFASGGKAVQLVRGGTPISHTVDLVPSTYGVWLYARVKGSKVMGPWPPVVIEMIVRTPDGNEELSSQRIAYQPMYQVVTRLFFTVRRQGECRISFAVGEGSKDSILLDFIEVRDELGECERRAVKQGRHMVDDVSLARIRLAHRRDRMRDEIEHDLPMDASVQQMIEHLDGLRSMMPKMNRTGRGAVSLAQKAQARSLEYEKYADPVSAREAALILVVLGDRNPTFCERVQHPAIFKDVSYNRFGRAYGHPMPAAMLPKIYDRIFDAIRKDTALAKAAQSLLPSVRTPGDLRAFFDCNVLQYELSLLFRYDRQGMQLYWERQATEVLLALGPNEVGQRWMDRFFRQTFADLTGDGGYQDTLLNSVNRDGTNFNGGAYYQTGVPLNLVMNAISLERYAQLGGNVPRSVYDPRVNARLLQAGQYFLNFRTAGGFRPVGGDGGESIRHLFDSVPLGGGTPHVRSRFYEWCFEKSGDPRLAWLAKAYGRTGDVGNNEWKTIQRAARKARNPVVHGDSVCMPDLGYSHLELGSESPDLKLKAAFSLHHGSGRGHAHGDLLDLTLLAYNRRIIPDGGRAGWPWMRFTAQHNTVEVDRTSFQSTGVNSGAYGYPILLRSLRGARFASAGGWSSSHPDLKDFRRDVVMVDLGVHGGRMVLRGDSAGGTENALRHCYVFDVVRVGGGSVHTYCTHGMRARKTEFSVPTSPAPDGPKALLYRAGEPLTGIASDPLVIRYLATQRGPIPGEFGMRHHIFGQGGRRFFTAKGRHKRYNWDVPYIWIERESSTSLHDTYASVFEPFYSETNLVSVRMLKIDGGAQGSRASRAVDVVSRWGRKDTIIISETGQPVRVEGGFETDAHFAFIAADSHGTLRAQMVGGTYLNGKGISIKAEQAAYEGKIDSFDPGTLLLDTTPPLPAEKVHGSVIQFGRLPHLTADKVVTETGQVRLTRSQAIYRSHVMKIDPAARAVYPRIAMPMTAAEPRYYDGTVATNESHEKYWRVERTEVAEMWMPLFTPIRNADVQDANGDGKRTVSVAGFAPPEKTRDPVILYYGPFEKPVRMRQFNRDAFKEPLILSVLRVDEAKRRLYFEPPADYDLVWNGWVYDGTVITNEAVNRQWRGNVPGREFRLILSGDAALSASDFPDADADGIRGIHLYHFGPGEPYRLETHVAVERKRLRGYRTESNVKSSVDLAGRTVPD
ncbi:MAG: hypothetical protein QGF00_07290 [Planctomycetota bacterium]|nr:hypothetical protein [Planctomycetota bacterium]